MIVLDTNVISEAMRGAKADTGVIRWLRSLPETPVTTVINRAEILAGLRLLPEGSRRSALVEVCTRVLSQFAICLPLTSECADHYGDIVATRRQAGRPIGSMDALIAAVVREVGATLATRDVTGFEGVGLDVVSPWDLRRHG